MSLRVNALYTEHKLKIYMQTDRLFALLLVFQWLLCIVLALVVTPKTWIGQTSAVHLHVWIAVVLGAVLNGFPLYLIWRHSGKAITRYAIATAQMLTGALLIHLTGGKIETHFHIFGSLAFLAFYRDWKVLALATVIVVFDHLFRGFYWSQSVFGVGDTDNWRWLEHAVWVAFEDVFLFYSCHKSRQEMKEIAEKQAALESTKTTIEEMVTLRTRELSEALHQQEALIQNIPDSVWLKDASLRYILVNPTFLKISKLRMKDILGKTDAELWSPETANKIYETDKKILTSGKTLHYEESFMDRDGKPVWFDTSQAPIKNDHNTIIGIVGLSRDITNRKLHEAQMNEANQNLSSAYDEIAKQLEFKTQMEKKLLQAQKMEAIGTLTGGIAHDFNNILWMIMGNSEMLLDELKDQPELLEIQQDIFNAADRAKSLVQQLLDFSRQRNDSDNFQPVMVAPLVKEVSKMVRNMLPSSIELKLNLTETSKTVLGDPTKIHQILMNLCTNAYQAMEEVGTLVIELSELYIDEATLENYPKVEQAGHYLLIEVSDTGSGIPPELMNRIFDPFFTTKEVGKGTGLGLATVHGLVSEMKGSIYVYSEMGRGTSFKIYLPAMDAEANELSPPIEPEALPVRVLHSDEPEKHILIVDDEQIIRQMLTRTLNNLGYRVSACTNGEEALQAFEAHPGEYDLIITDQTMPRMTGIELAKNVLNVSAEQAIILATGYSKVITEQEFSTVNIRKIMNKPFHMQELTRAVSEILKS